MFSSFNLIITVSTEYTIAGSSSSGDIPPPTGGEGGDTGGGSAAGGLYLNYRIPLIFKSGPFGPTLIAITTFQNNTPIIFGFNSTEYEDNVAELNIGETLILDPRIEINLTNGSLIQTFTPIQIDVYHNQDSSSFDDTFSYSVLVMSMWGKRYQVPFDNLQAMVVAGFNQTEIDIQIPGEETQYIDLPFVGQTIDLELKKGSIIEANGPIGVVFYSVSTDDGSYAFTGIPSYLWGKEYFIYPAPSISGIPLLDGETIITLTTISEGELIFWETDLLNSDTVELSDNSTVDLPNQILLPSEQFKHVSSLYTNFSTNIMYNYTINNTSHKAAVSYIAPDKMKWAELFLTNPEFHNQELKSIVAEDDSPILPLLVYNYELYVDISNFTTLNRGDFFNYNANTTYGFIGNGSFFSFLLTSPPETTGWNSSANMLYPLNLYSYFDNTSSFFPSWYRFPNINVKEVLVSPSNPTEFRRLELDIRIQNNGTIPSAPFYVTVYVNDTLKIHKSLDGLDINQSIPVIYEEFQGIGKKILNVSIFTDSLSQIFELYEFDNSLEFFVEITRNWNIIYISIAIGVAVIGFIVYRIVRRSISQSKKRRTRFDVILSEIEV
ncbi:MAG: hypothetical protein ACXABK_01360 [Candidatus Heimdallarchaeaceae archaeon]